MQSIVSARNTRRREAPWKPSNIWDCAVAVGEDEEKEEGKSSPFAHPPAGAAVSHASLSCVVHQSNVRRRSGSTSHPYVNGEFGPSSFAPSCATSRQSTVQHADNSPRSHDPSAATTGADLNCRNALWRFS
jgi:hypothetical protein